MSDADSHTPDHGISWTAFWKGYIQTQWGTTCHKTRVLWHTLQFCWELIKRVLAHDLSKYSWSEASHLARTIDRLSETTYGSDEYEELKSEVDAMLDHHYKNNDHHPEHHGGDVYDMDLFQFCEMVIDWYAATHRHDDGDIYESIEHNSQEYGIGPNLRDKLLSVADFFEGGRDDDSTG